MKLTCDRAELAEATAFAGAVVPTRSPRPMLLNLKIQADERGVEVLGTDLEVGLRVVLSLVDVERRGAGLLPAAKVSAILKELSADKVEVSVEGGVTTIRAEGSEFRIPTESASEFPSIPAFEDTAKDVVELDRAALERMVRKTAFAAATESTRYALNGVLFDFKDDGRLLRLVATDGKRLALVERALAADAPAAAGTAGIHVVVPTKGVQMLARLAGADEETVKLRFLAGQLHAASARAMLSAQLIQGRFPPYEEVIPRDHDKKVTLDTGVLMAALRRASLFTTKDSLGVRFAFAYNKLTLAARAAEVGEATLEVPIEYPYDPLETLFNPHLLIEALKAVESGSVTIELKEATTAAVVREPEGLTYVVMPINLT